MPYSSSTVAFEDAAMQIQEHARKLMHRESTNYLGRMGEALMEVQCVCGDGEAFDVEKAVEYRELMIELAALAMVQAAIVEPGMVMMT